jgi:hypothetical protein
MRILFSAFCFLVIQFCSAQLTKPDHSVVLYSGEITTGEKLLYEALPLKDAVFNLDGEIFESEKVGFFQNNHGYFANLSKFHGPRAERYALRIKKGKINLFEEIEIDVYGGDELMIESDDERDKKNDMTLATGQVYQYYTMETGELKKATYKNLKLDLASNPASMKYLHSYRNYCWLQRAMIGVGAGIITYDIIRQSGGPVKFNPFMAMGIVIGGSSYFLQNAKTDAMWFAAEEFNK